MRKVIRSSAAGSCCGNGVRVDIIGSDCEYTDLLTDASKLSSDKFWELERRIKGDKKLKGVTCEMSRSTMIYNLMNLYREGAIDDSDFDGFNDELVRCVKDAAKW